MILFIAAFLVFMAALPILLPCIIIGIVSQALSGVEPK
jgi:hypothetical protein